MVVRTATTPGASATGWSVTASSRRRWSVGPRPTSSVVGEEHRRAYDRVHLSSVFDGAVPDDLTLGDADFYDDPAVELVLGDHVVALDTGPPHRRPRPRVADRLRALRARHRVVPVRAADPPAPTAPGASCTARSTTSTPSRTGRWAGHRRGGRRRRLLGLEAASALPAAGVATTVVEFALRLMAVQLGDGGAGPAPASERLSVCTCGPARPRPVPSMRTATARRRRPDVRRRPGPRRRRGRRSRPASAAETSWPAMPAYRAASWPAVSSWTTRCATSAPGVWAIGEVACHRGRRLRARRPRGTPMAGRRGRPDRRRRRMPLHRRRPLDVAQAARRAGGQRRRPARRRRRGARRRPAVRPWQKAIVGDDGSASSAPCSSATPHRSPTLVQALRSASRLADVIDLRPAGRRDRRDGLADLPDEAGVCSCHNVSCGPIRAAVRDGCEDVAGGQGAARRPGTGCGSCVPVLQELIDARAAPPAGKVVAKRLCPHFA